MNNPPLPPEKDLNKFLKDRKLEKSEGEKVKFRKTTQMTAVGKGVCFSFSSPESFSDSDQWEL